MVSWNLWIWNTCSRFRLTFILIIIIIRSAITTDHHAILSCVRCRASGTNSQQSSWIWSNQFLEGLPRGLFHPSMGSVPSWVRMARCSKATAGTSCDNLATCPKRPRCCWCIVEHSGSWLVWAYISALVMWSDHLTSRILCRAFAWNTSSLFESCFESVPISLP